MLKVFFSFTLIMAGIFLVFLTSQKTKKINGIERDIAYLLSETIIQDRLETLKTSVNEHKAFAAVIDDRNVYVYGFSFGHSTQELADLTAFEKCEETRKLKGFNIDKECILLNELIYNH